MFGSPFEGQFVNLDDILPVGGSGEVERAAATVDEQVAAFGVGDDQHGVEFRVECRASRNR